MQILKRFPDTLTANMARANLAQHGIDAFVADEVMANVDPRVTFAMGGVRLMVRDEEIRSAAEVLQITEPLDPLESLPAPLPGSGVIETEVDGPFPFGDQCRTIFAWFVFLYFALFFGQHIYETIKAVIRW